MDNKGESADLYMKKAKLRIFSDGKWVKCSIRSCCNTSVPQALRIHAVLVVFLDIGCCCGFFWGVPPGRSRYAMAPSPVIRNKARLCKVIRCCAGTAMGSGPRGEMPRRYSSPGPLRQTSEWERRVRKSSVCSSTLVWFALPYSIKH